MYNEELNKKKFSLKAMYYNRFLGIRYLLAILFFTNLYWLVLLGYYGKKIYIPLIAIIFMSIAIIENIKVYSDNQMTMRFTQIALYIQIVINLVLIGISNTSKFSYYFFFMIQNESAKVFIVMVLLIGIILCGICIKKISLIRNNKDKQYTRIIEYKKATGL